MNAAVSSDRAAALTADGLTVLGGARQLVTDLSMAFASGEFVAVLGRNGSGKTLTLHTLAGLRQPASGTVRLHGADMSQLGRRQIAQQLGILMQDLEESFTTTALQAVLIGRHPHLKLWQWEGTEDERVARAALSQVGLSELAERSTSTLSGGEQRRLAIATLLAQQPQLFLLDEPTNHLDPHHQLAILTLFRELADKGATVIATLHDPTLAARFADRVLLLFDNGRWIAGATADTLNASVLSELYLSPILELTAHGKRIFVSA